VLVDAVASLMLPLLPLLVHFLALIPSHQHANCD
jgi:hypothetical protein